MGSEQARVRQIESGVRIGDFEIEKRLGAGGMGIVYQARQVSLNRRVALKVLGPALTQGADLARFQREAQAAARLQHPGIAALYFVGQDGELCYHVMELIQGVPLRRVIDRLAETQEAQSGPDTVVGIELTGVQAARPLRFDQPTTDHEQDFAAQGDYSLSPAAKQMRRSQAYLRRCCEIIRDVARALMYAHENGVVHRDIKSENLMLDQNGQMHIIDFGLARFFDDVSITNTGQLVGTPLYMSPEQVTGRVRLDHRSDIYSLGMVLYELLTLRRPIEFTSRENLLRNIVTKALPPLCCRNTSVPRVLEGIVHKATNKDPEERYQTAAGLADDLDRFLAGQPVTAPAYRYHLDVRETVAARPGLVVLASFQCLLAGFTAFTCLAAIAVMMSVMVSGAALLIPLAQVAIGLTALAGGAFCSRGLLRGWNWMRWVVITLAGIGVLACVGAGFVLGYVAMDAVSTAKALPPPEASQDAQKAEGSQAFSPHLFILGMVGMYAVPLLLAFLSAATTLVSLILPSTRAWFRHAGEARLEHRRILKLGE